MKITGIVSNTNGYADTSIFVLLPIHKAMKKTSVVPGTERFSPKKDIPRGLLFFLLPGCGHGAPFRNIIPLPATQGFPAEVPTGSRSFLVDGTTPFPDAASVGILFAQVLAGGVGKKITVGFLKAPFTEVMQIVGFALTDRYYGEPAAAFAATAAGAGDRGFVL